MRFSTVFTSLALSLLASAAPTRFSRRAEADILVLTFADVLEQLEKEFYRQGIEKFTEADFVAAGFTNPQAVIQTLQTIQESEATHSTVLQAGLKARGGEPVTSCQFDFTSALVDVPTMAATARVVENVGVSAYIGGAVLMTDPQLLAAAGSILSVEARHSTMLNALSAGTPIPAAFDIPMTPSEILALAGPFISGCDLGIPANPPLAITNTGVPAIGTTLTFSSSALNGTTDGFFCQMMVGGAAFSIPLPISQCTVPEGINGPVAIWITSDNQPLANNLEARATTQLIAGPTYAFIDSKQDLIGQMFRNTNGATVPGTTITTQTISPEAAQTLIDGAASAQPTPTGTEAVSSASAEATATPSGAEGAAPSATGGAVVVPIEPATPANGAAAADSPNPYVGPSGDGKTTVLGWLRK